MPRDSAPIRIFNRKVFVGRESIDFLYFTEPIPVGDFQRLDMAFTIHGASPNLTVGMGFEQSAQPETANAENWTALGATVSETTNSFAGGKNGITTAIIHSGFLPWIRGYLQIQPITPGSGTWVIEVSAIGHLHKDIE